MFLTKNIVFNTLTIVVTLNSLLIVTIAKRPRKTTIEEATTTKPPVPQYCPELKGSLATYNVPSIIKILNHQYNGTGSYPQSHEECYDTLDKLLDFCSVVPIMYDEDALTLNHSSLIIKIRYNEGACRALSHIISKFLDHEGFGKLHVDEKVILLALGYSPSGNSAITEWIGLIYENGKITTATQHAPCLWDRKYEGLAYKGKRVVDFFPHRAVI